MAVPALVGYRGDGFNKTSGTTFAVTTNATITAGNLIVAEVLFDNAATASKPIVSGFTKMAGETASWVFLGAARSTSTSAGAFASGELWCILTTVNWSAAAYTVTLDTAVVMKSFQFHEFSGVTATQRSTVGTAYSTTTTAASAATTGTTPQTNDLAVGLIFGSNVAAIQAGDTDTTGGSWSTPTSIGSTGSSGATNNFGLFQYKVLTSGVHQTLNNSAAMTAGNGAIVAVLQFRPEPAISQAAYGFYDDAGTESGAAALAAQNTPITGNLANGDGFGVLRVRLQETGSGLVPATDDFRLQWEKNANGTWNNTIPPQVLADSYPASNQSTTRSFGVTGTPPCYGLGQSFLGNGSTLTQAGFYLQKVGSPTGTLTAFLFAHTGTLGTDSRGTGSPLATSTTSIDVSTVTTGFGWYYFNFDGTFTLANGTPYMIIVQSDTINASNYLNGGTDNTSPTHAGNLATTSAIGSSWGALASNDFVFEVYTGTPAAAVVPYDNPNLTEGAATTNRLTGGTGTFVAGKVTEAGDVTNVGWATSNYTELIYSLKLVAANFTKGDVVRFRVLRNGATATMTYAVTPTINIAAPYNERLLPLGIETTVTCTDLLKFRERASEACLVPSIGVVTTPDPGPLPTTGFVFVFKALGPYEDSFNSQCLVSQNRADSTRSYRVNRRGVDGAAFAVAYPSGTLASAVNIISGIPAARSPVNPDTYAVSWNATTGAWKLMNSVNGGVSYTDSSTGTGTPTDFFDSSDVMTIGAAETGTTTIFDGKIYRVELRTGNDPLAGTLLWCFKSTDYPGSGTSYVDPRGQTWTLATAAAITPAVMTVAVAAIVTCTDVQSGPNGPGGLIGYNVIGTQPFQASGATTRHYAHIDKTYVAFTGDVVTQVAVYGDGTGQCQVGFYTVDPATGLPKTLIAPPITVSIGATAGWYTAAASVPLSFGVKYSVAIDLFVDESWNYYFDQPGGTIGAVGPASPGALPATWVQFANNISYYSFYATVTGTAGAGSVNYNETGRSITIAAATTVPIEKLGNKELALSITATAATTVTDRAGRKDLALSVPVALSITPTDRAGRKELALSTTVAVTVTRTDTLTTTTLPAALLAYNFSESGTTATDQSGNGRHASLLVGSTPTDLHSSGQLLISAAGRRLAYTPDAAALPAYASVTLKFTTSAERFNEQNLWSKMRVTDSSNFNLYIEGAQLSAVVRGTTTVGPSIITSAGPALTGNTTYQAALTYDGTTTRMYLNGVEVATATTATGPLDMTGTDTTWSIGDAPADTNIIPLTENFLIDDVRFFDVALTAAQVALAAATPVASAAAEVTYTKVLDQRVVANGASSGSGNYTSSAFATTAGTVLVAIIGVGVNGNSSSFDYDMPRPVTSGLTWIPRCRRYYAENFSAAVEIWVADNPTGGSKTISQTGAGTWTSSVKDVDVVVLELTGAAAAASQSNPFATGGRAYGAGVDPGAQSLTLPVAPAAGSLVVAATMNYVYQASAVVYTVTPGADMTELAEHVAGVTDTNHFLFQAQARVGSTSQTVAWQDLQAGGTNPETYVWAIAAAEFKLAGSTPNSQAARFNGGSNFYKRAAFGFPATTDFTLTFWLKLAVDLDTYTPAVALGDGTTYAHFGTGSSGSLLGRDVWTGGSNTGFNLVVGRWCYFANTFTVAGANGLMFWVENELAMANGYGQGTPWNFATPALDFFIAHDSFGGVFDGSVAAVKIWSAVLTPAELQAEQFSSNPVRTANLFAYYPFAGGPSTVDEGPLGKTLTQNGSPVLDSYGPPVVYIPSTAGNLYNETGRSILITASVTTTDLIHRKELALALPVAATTTVTDVIHRKELGLSVTAAVATTATDLLRDRELILSVPVVATTTAADLIHRKELGLALPAVVIVTATDVFHDRELALALPVAATTTATDRLNNKELALATTVAGTVTVTDIIHIGSAGYNETGRQVPITATTVMVTDQADFHEPTASLTLTAITVATVDQADYDELALSITGVGTTTATTKQAYKELALALPVAGTTTITDLLKLRELGLSVPVAGTTTATAQADFEEPALSVPVAATTTLSIDRAKRLELALANPATVTTTVTINKASYRDLPVSLPIVGFVTAVDLQTSPGHYDETQRSVLVAGTTTLAIDQTDYDQLALSVPTTATVTLTDLAHRRDLGLALLIAATTTCTDVKSTHYSEPLAIPVAATTTATVAAHFRDLSVSIPIVGASSLTTDSAHFRLPAQSVTIAATTQATDNIHRAEASLTVLTLATVTSTNRANFRQLDAPIDVTATVTAADSKAYFALALAVLILAVVKVTDSRSRTGVVKLNDADAVFVGSAAVSRVYQGAVQVWP